MSWRDQTAPDSSNVWEAKKEPKTAEHCPGSIRLWAIKRDFMGCWKPKARNHVEMPSLLGRRAKKWIQIAELELDEG